MRKMAGVLLFVSAVVSVGGAPAGAQMFFDETSACAAIRSPGLFYVRSQPTLKISQVWPGNGDALVYDRGARFVLVTSAANPERNPDYEGVWHVRTQTMAEGPKANKAHVYRPPAQTRCGFMPDLPPGERMVSLGTYLDHHLSDPGNPRPKTPALSRGFHLKIQDVADGACVATDDRREFDVAATYGFQDIDRREVATNFESGTSLARPAIASRTPYHGLSSQFVYRASPGGACVSFEAPIPTGPVPRSRFWASAYDDAVEAAATWKPSWTLVVLKRLEGRRVVNVMSRKIFWRNE